MSGPLVLLVEDEQSYVDALSIGLQREGFSIAVARDGGEAIAKFDALHPDLVLLDVMLPGLSGVDVCREIRGRSNVPIIMVTAKSSEIDTVVGLEVGADDYVTKPYRLRELVARMRVALRRTTEAASDGAANSDFVELGDVRIDVDSREVVVRGTLTQLPLKEFELLLLLMENPGRVLSRTTLIERVWGYDYFGDTKTLDVHIKRLRAKIEEDSHQPTRILTVRGVGYKYASPR
jgi:two-component system response regulator RegX3